MIRKSPLNKRRSAPEADRSASFDAKRKEIGEAAVRVFDRLGFEGASITALAQELGTDRSSLYYYITSKDELFDEVLRTLVEQNLNVARRIEESAASPPAKLRDLITALMASYGAHYPLFYIYIRENLSHVSDSRMEWSKEMRAMNSRTTDVMIAIIEQGYADGSFRNIGSSRVVAYGIFGVVGWTSRWFRPEGSDVDAAAIGTTFAEMMLAGLEAPY